MNNDSQNKSVNESVNQSAVKPTLISLGAKRMLRIDASPRKEGSISREVGNLFQAEFESRLGTKVTIRDLNDAIIPQLDATTVGGFFTPAEQRTEAMTASLELSNTLIDEIRNADVLLLTVPMFNFGIPASLKAWVDQIVRVHETFSFDGQNFGGLVQNKEAHIVIAYGAGGYAPGQAFAVADFAAPFLKFVLGFIGITNTHVHAIEGTNTNAAAAREVIETFRTVLKATDSKPLHVPMALAAE
jgi:FMN-dependent NADH-azoreductase